MIKLPLSMLLMIWAAVSALDAAEEAAFAPSQWWLVGPYACYSAADFEATEPIENAKNKTGRCEQWNRVVGMGGRELRTLVVQGLPNGFLDLEKQLGPVTTNVCAYAGFLMRAEKAGTATATLTAEGPVRWFLNNKLVAETKQAGVQKAEVTLVAGMNSLMAKSWKTGSSWKVGFSLEGLPLTAEPAPATAEPPKPLTGRRNVALWKEGSKVAVSSYAWRSFPINERGLTALNDGLSDAAWTSSEVDRLPQWAWVRFPGMRKVDEVVVHVISPDRRPLDMVGEYTEDGGVTFKTLFHVTDPKDLTIRAKFPPVVTDNVRIRINRAAVPEKSGFAVAQLAEIEVFGEDAVGSGSLALTGAAPAVGAKRLEPDAGFKPTVVADEATVTVSTPWYQVVLDRHRPRLVQLRLDSLGKGEFKIDLLRRSGATPLLAPLFDRPDFLPDGKLELDGNTANYPAVKVDPGVNLRLAIRFHEKDFELDLATASDRNVPLEGGVFRFDFDFWQTPTTYFGRLSDRANFVSLPCYIHAPDAGTLRVTQTGDASVFRLCASADDFDLSARQFLNIAPSDGVLPKGNWHSNLRFAVDSPRPFPEITSKEPRLDGMARYALNIAQWTPSKRVLINNMISTPCPHDIQWFAEMALYSPILQDNISLMDLMIATVDHYLDGQVGHIYWNGNRVDGVPAGKWTISLDSYGNLLNSAWYAIHTVGGQPLLERWLPKLEAVVANMEAHDTDGDGIVDSVDMGDWFDAYDVAPGSKEAYSTINNYVGLLHLAELEEQVGRTAQADHYRQLAQLIKSNFLKVFYNPETGVIGGWRDKQGNLRDRMFPWVNAYAVCSDIIDEPMARQIMEKLQAKMKEIGYGERQYPYGMICNLLPTQPGDFQSGNKPWQGYMNGSITPPFSHYYIKALRKVGMNEEAEKMLWAQVKSFDEGIFNAGVRIPFMPQRNPKGSAFFKWDGSSAIGEGYLPENWHAYASIFEVHYGIRFDKNGYSLEPWSPLKGQKVRCGLPVNGKIQEFME